MRNIYIFIFACCLFFVECKSIDKLVEQGRYDEAFSLAVDKLAGKKDKERKYVIGLEKAFNQLQQADLTQVNNLLLGPHDHQWDKIASIYSKLERRQQILNPIMPLRSKDGYLARFSFTDYSSEIAQAKEKAANYKYNSAMSFLENAHNGDRYAARNAFDLLADVAKYNPNFMDVIKKQDEAYQLGLEIYAIDFEANVPAYMREIFLRDLNAINPSGFNTFWRKFDFADPFEDKDFDGSIVVEISEVNMGREREIINNYNVEKNIVDGTVARRDSLGHVVKDSLGRTITDPKYVTVLAHISEIKREKISQLYGSVKFYSNTRNYAASTNPIEVNFVFNDVAADFRGDQRALDNSLKALTRKNILNFPDQFLTTETLSGYFFREVNKKISSMQFGA